jgi:ABC-2 type transport system ATP-binding protein
MIDVNRLCKRYDTKVAVNDLTFSVAPGEIVGFLGPNGAGKSTTVKILTGMIRASSGSARVAGFDIAADPIEVKKRIGLVPETATLFETLTGWEYLGFIGELHHLDRDIIDRRRDEFLNLFGLWSDKDLRLQGYSKGMKQKVMIAAALIHDPEVIFLDEPLNGLDASTALVFKEVVRSLSVKGKTILFCSHVLEVVEKICPRIMIINHGALLVDGTPAAIAVAAGQPSLEEAFCTLTGVRDARDSANDFLQALGE